MIVKYEGSIRWSGSAHEVPDNRPCLPFPVSHATDHRGLESEEGRNSRVNPRKIGPIKHPHRSQSTVTLVNDKTPGTKPPTACIGLSGDCDTTIPVDWVCVPRLTCPTLVLPKTTAMLPSTTACGPSLYRQANTMLLHRAQQNHFNPSYLVPVSN